MERTAILVKTPKFEFGEGTMLPHGAVPCMHGATDKVSSDSVLCTTTYNCPNQGEFMVGLEGVGERLYCREHLAENVPPEPTVWKIRRYTGFKE